MEHKKSRKTTISLLALAFIIVISVTLPMVFAQERVLSAEINETTTDLQAAVEPETAEESTEPETTEPEPTEPENTDPEPTEPENTEPDEPEENTPPAIQSFVEDGGEYSSEDLFNIVWYATSKDEVESVAATCTGSYLIKTAEVTVCSIGETCYVSTVDGSGFGISENLELGTIITLYILVRA